MSTNEKIAATKFRSWTCSDPALPASNDPVVCGQQGGIAVTAEATTGPSAGKTTVAVNGQFDLSVKGIDGGGNSAVADGDILYYVAADTPKLSKKNTGVRFGYAKGAVVSGATTTIPVEIGF